MVPLPETNFFSWLHNMSCRPNVEIKHKGVDQCHRLRFSLKQFGLPKNFSFKHLCPLFGVVVPSNGDAWKALTEAVNLPCPLLHKLPATASVVLNTHGDELPNVTDNPRVVLAVLSRCSGTIFMRDWPPVITLENLRRSVTLIAPMNWKPTP